MYLQLVCTLLCAACGSVGEPLPPLLNIPERSQDFTVRQRLDQIIAEWTWPRVTTEGMPLKDLARFKVHGMAIADPNQLPPADVFERQGRQLAALESQALDPYTPGEKVQFTLPAEPMKGKIMALAVRAESSRGRSIGFSNLAVIQVIEPPRKPGRPRADVKPDAILIEWPAAEGARSYRVFRRSESEAVFAEIGRSKESSFRDPDFQWNQNYHYRVGSLGQSATGEVEGPVSETVSVPTKDTFAPGKPRDLRAVLTAGSVELSWGQNQEADLAGYHVRRSEGDGPETVLNQGLLSARAYSDRTIEAGHVYSYTVSAVDRSSNESARSEPVEVNVPQGFGGA